MDMRVPRLKFDNISRFSALAVTALGLAGCQETGSGMSNSRAWKPIPSETVALMQEKGTNSHAPMLIRAYKKEAELEVWKMKNDGRYTLVKTFPMCRWSGQLGPKTREGDRQVPEGFYAITPGQMNPNSNYYLSFNVGYPNAYDKAWNRGGGLIMVHGACSSAGCFSMTDNQIAEIYAIARESFGGGQRAIQMQSLPFRMTAENLAKHRLDPNMPFWKQLKAGTDRFDVTKQEPSVGVCARKYVFDAADGSRLDPNGACPPAATDEISRLVAEKDARDEVQMADFVAKGVKPVKVVYEDGGQHPDFRSKIADVSRPDSLVNGPTEIALDEGKHKGKVSPIVKMAQEKAAKEQAAKEQLAKAGEPDAKPAAGALEAKLAADTKPAAPGTTNVAKAATAVPAKTAAKASEKPGTQTALKPASDPLPPEASALAPAPAESSMFSRILGRSEAPKPSDVAPPSAPVPDTTASTAAKAKIAPGRASAPAKPATKPEAKLELPAAITGGKQVVPALSFAPVR